MDKKEEFKEFVRENPRLVKYIKNGEMTWQKFYEMYDIYGKENEIWKDYLTVSSVGATTSAISFSQILNWIKGINLDDVQSGIGNLQRVIGMVQDLTNKDGKENINDQYQPRPLYKHFDD